MNPLDQAEFEKLYPNFYADFGVRGTVKLPSSIQQKDIVAALLSGQESLADQAIEISQAHITNEQYYCQLSHRSNIVDKFACTKAQYDEQIVPVEAIAAAKILSRGTDQQ
ncbi:hypothetical protein ACQ4M3_39775 [Leptolyngbya sp. AN03gr2]|uniref:hypothetical protein n=1 Tax=unclassified Leptolyngbya TaxID=2650499 RepID=UPI003D31B4A6